LIVLDSFGIGGAPDAAAFGDAGSDTLKAVAASPHFKAPNLQKLGLFNIEGVAGLPREVTIRSARVWKMFATIPKTVMSQHNSRFWPVCFFIALSISFRLMG